MNVPILSRVDLMNKMAFVLYENTVLKDTECNRIAGVIYNDLLGYIFDPNWRPPR